jgi:CheY-like chemotaxis protein
MVVDDNRDAADSTGELLSLMGAEVRIAYDGASALDLVRGWKPSLALLDIGMPGMDGHELARRMRGAMGRETPYLAALTGWGQDQDRAHTRSSGFDQHLVKPVDLQALQQLLTAAGGVAN